MISRPPKIFLAFTAVLFGVSSAASSVRADDDPADHQAKARALFAEGRTLVASQRYAEGCERFEESLRFVAGTGTKYNLADCWEKLGRTASAQALFLGVAADARAAGDGAREQVARERAAALEPRLVRLLVEVETTVPGLVVRRNHVEVPAEQWGTAIAVDPGSYEITATAPNGLRFSKHVRVPASGGLVSVTIAPSVAAPVVVAAVPERPAEVPPAPPPPVEEKPAISAADLSERALPPPPSARWWATTEGRVALGLGAVALAGATVGTVFALQYRSKNDEALSICPATATQCTRADIDRHAGLVEDARSARLVAALSYGAGVAALAGAAVMYVRARRGDAPAERSTRLSVLAAPGTAGLAMVGSW